MPPPDWWMRAVSLIAWNMPSMLSSTGRTKHAESCCISWPAARRVGEFGRKSGPVISSRKRVSQREVPSVSFGA